MCLLLLWGCDGNGTMDRAVSFRSRFQGSACNFRATVTADYGEQLHTFVMDCQSDDQSKLDFTVVAPDSIAGITGWISGDDGFRTFDRNLLAISPLAEGQLSPVCAPWVLINTLRSGYLRYCSEIENGYRLTMNDTYEEQAMAVEIWLDADGIPLAGEILWQGRRILTVSIENFVFV